MVKTEAASAKKTLLLVPSLAQVSKTKILHFPQGNLIASFIKPY